jgi:hypothetical protein
MTRVGDYCFNLNVVLLILAGSTAILTFAPGVIQAAFLLVVASCPVTSIYGLCKAAGLHQCYEGWAEVRRPDEEEEVPSNGPYAGLVRGMFSRR